MTRPRTFRNILSNYASKLASLAVWLILTPFVLDHLGVDDFGLWTIVGSIVGYGSLLDLAISAAIIKYVAEHRARGENAAAREIVATALAAYLAVGALLALVAVLAAPAIASLMQIAPDQRPTAVRLVIVMGIGVAIAIPCTATIAVLRGLHRFDLAGLLTVISALFSALGVVLVLHFDGGVLGLAMVNVVVLVVMQIPSVWLIHRAAPELGFGLRGASRARLRDVLSFSSSLFVVNAAGRLETKTDEIVIGTLMPVSAVTPYALAHRVSELPSILTDQFMRVIPPLASALDAGAETGRLSHLYTMTTRLGLVAFLPVAAALTALAGPLLTLWVGPEYAAAGYLVGILTLASLIDTSQWPAAMVLQGMARHRPLAILAVISGLANLILSIVLCLRVGLVGVAIGTLIPTAIVSLGFVQPYAMRVIGVSASQMIRDVYRPALLPVPVMALVLYGLQSLFAPASVVAVTAVAVAGVVTYAGVYLGATAPAEDRAIARGLLTAMLKRGRAGASGPNGGQLEPRDGGPGGGPGPA